MNRYVCLQTMIWIIPMLVHSAVLARGEETDVVSEAHAKGIVVLRASFPSRGELHSYGLEISMDGETFVDANVGPTRGLRFGSIMVRGSHETDSTILIVPVVGRFDFTPQGFLFGSSGTYRLRWNIAFKDRNLGGLNIEQTVDVEPATETDLELLARMGDRRFLADLGLNPPQDGTLDLLALGLIAELLEHAQDDPGEEGRVEGKPEWADTFMSLAREYPESSYAPYLAYYAARLYLNDLGRVTGSAGISPELKKQPLYRKAIEALQFSIGHGDPFLGPRALCSLAFANMLAGSWKDAEEFLVRADDRAAGQGAVLSIVEDMRGELARAKKRQAARKQ